MSITATQAQAQEITLVQVWVTQEDRGVPGALTLQLMVDDELKEYVVRATPNDAAALAGFLDKLSAAPAPEPPVIWRPALRPEPMTPHRWAEASFMRT
jgi:hypothetical protein